MMPEPGFDDLHAKDCNCTACREWYAGMAQMRLTGRCGHCQAPIDDHAKDARGLITLCPTRSR